MNLFSHLESLIPSLDGWCTVERAQMLAASVLTLRPNLTIVLGVWGGRDTFAMALAHKQLGHGKVIAVDPWHSGASVQGQVGEHKAFWSNQESHDEVYKKFMANRESLGLTDFVQVERMQSDYFDPVDAGIIIIDGNHGPQAATDARRYAPKVIMGGLLYLDDLEWPNGGVGDAEKFALSAGFKKLGNQDGGRFYQRICN